MLPKTSLLSNEENGAAPQLPIVSALPMELGDWLSFISAGEWCEREDTISGILELLHTYRLVQV